MSHDEALRRQVQEQMQQNQNLQKVEPHQVGSYHDQQVINAEIERQRRLREQQS